MSKFKTPAGGYEGFVEFADATLISVQCFEGRCSQCPDGHDPESASRPPTLAGYYCTHGCNGENQPAGGDADRKALNEIAEMLRDPRWGLGMLEDIAEILARTGRSVKNYPDDRVREEAARHRDIIAGLKAWKAAASSAYDETETPLTVVAKLIAAGDRLSEALTNAIERAP
jgi:hypothetical protein